MKAISVFVIVLCVIHVTLAQCPWYEADRKAWSNPANWPSGKVPVAGDDVVVPANMKMIFDGQVAGIVYNSVTIDKGAQLLFDGAKANIIFEANWILVKETAAFRIGGASCPYTNKATITLYGPKNTTQHVVPGMGTKGIISAGTLAFFGYVPTPTFTRIQRTLWKGNSSFLVQDDLTGWKVGHVITLTTTDYYEHLNEQFTITAISGKNITVSAPIRYTKWGDNDEYAEVLHLTRNIVIQGDVSSDATGFGGHCLVYGNGTAKIQGVEFTRMGQKNVLARYPFHFHMQLDQSKSGSFVKGCSFRDTYQRCLTIHGTSGIPVSDNVAFNITGHCYFLEDGSETMNTFTNNIGVWIKPGSMVPSDSKASVFWITNPNNSYVGNVAVGGNYGFWMALPAKPSGLSSYMTWIYPRSTPLGRFDNNVAHSNKANGIQVDECPNADGTTVIQCDYIAWKIPGNGGSGYHRNTFYGLKAWKNRQYGIWIRGSYITVDNAYLIDNGIGINVPTTSNLVTNSVIVGETPNAGTTWMTSGWNDMGRSRPKLYSLGFPIHGMEVYDSAGNQFARNVTFRDFVSDNIRKAGAIGAVAHGYYILPPNNIFAELKFENSNEWIMEPNYYYYDGPKQIVITDADGSFTGDVGGVLVSNTSILTFDSNCTCIEAWGPFCKCNRNENGYSHLTIVNTDTLAADYGASLNMTYRATWIPLGRPDIQTPIKGIDPRNSVRSQYATNVISRKAYLLQFPHATPPKLQVNLRFASSGEWVVAVLSYPNTSNFTITRGYDRSPLKPGLTVDDLAVDTYFYDSVNQYLYVMYMEDSGGITGAATFPQYQWGTAYVDITASCGKNCLVTTAQAIPPALNDKEDKYRSSLQGCTASTTSKYTGHAFFTYNQKTKRATYIIHHNVPRATYAVLEGKRSGVLVQFPVPQGPIRGAISITYEKHNELWNGDWSITIKNDDPNSAIKGYLGCFGLCSPPPYQSAWDPCTMVAPLSVPIYDEGLNADLGWIDWTYGVAARNITSEGDARCGSKAIAVNYSGFGSLTLHVNGACAPGTCSAGWMKPYISVVGFTHFEFYVKSPAGAIPIPLTIKAQNEKDKYIGGGVNVKVKHIDNFFIENTWTRVRVPLSEIGFTGTEMLGTFSIQMNGNLASPWLVLFDSIKMVSDYTDPITKPPAGQIKLYSSKC